MWACSGGQAGAAGRRASAAKRASGREGAGWVHLGRDGEGCRGLGRAHLGRVGVGTLMHDMCGRLGREDHTAGRSEQCGG